MTNRRSFLIGAASLLVAPAIVRAESLMPIFVPKPPAIDLSDGGFHYAEAMNALIRAQLDDLFIFGSTFTVTDPTSPIGIRRVEHPALFIPA